VSIVLVLFYIALSKINILKTIRKHVFVINNKAIHCAIAAETRCPKPTLPVDAADMPLDDSYRVGANVQVTCRTGTDFRNITCLSDGSWTPLVYVCGSKRHNRFSISSNLMSLLLVRQLYKSRIYVIHN